MNSAWVLVVLTFIGCADVSGRRIGDYHDTGFVCYAPILCGFNGRTVDGELKAKINREVESQWFDVRKETQFRLFTRKNMKRGQQIKLNDFDSLR